MSDTPIYTFFLDDVYSFYCPTCGLCCRGKGLCVDMQQEGPRLLQQFPNLRPFVCTAERLAIVRNLEDRCWFFDEESGLCEIERTISKDAKPLLCNLFPYDTRGIYQGHLIVSINFLCPVRTTLVEGAVPINRANFLEDFLRLNGTSLIANARPCDLHGVDLGREMQIRELCRSAAGKRDYSELCDEQYRIYFDDAIDDLGDYYRGLLSKWHAFFGLADSLSPEIAGLANREMTWITPSLRGYLTAPPADLPIVLLAIYFLVRQSLAISPRITAKQIMSIANGTAALILLPLLDRIPRLPFDQRTPRAHFQKLEPELRKPSRQWEKLMLNNHRNGFTLLEMLERLDCESVDQKLRVMLGGPRSYANIGFTSSS